MERVEPEHELIRRVLPYAAPATALALLIGGLLDGWGAGWSAGIGVAVVVLNFVAHGLSMAWAARISPTLMMAVGLGGFGVRFGVLVGIMVLLNTLPWFSPVAFAAAVVPATVLLLAFEGKLISGRMQGDLWIEPRAVHR